MKLANLFLIILTSFSVSTASVNEENNNDTKIVELSSLAINGFLSQEEDSAGVVYQQENGNQYIKLAYSTAQYSSFYFESVECIAQNGTYKFEADIRYSETLDTDNIFINIFGENGAINKTIAESKRELDAIVTPSSIEGWSKLTAYFTITDYYQKFYECLKFGYNTKENKTNYLDIDNIKISFNSSMEFNDANVDANRNGDFESFEANTLLNKEDWQCNDTYYIKDKLENSIIEENGNKVLKLYTSETNHTSITKGITPSITTGGWYQLSFKAKGGSKFKTDNIGYRMISSNGSVVKDTIIDYSKVNSKDWVELTSQFYIYPTSVAEWLNLSLWVFTNNDKRKSENNYLLIDDIKISSVKDDGEFGKNLFYNGEIKDFYASQGRVIHDVSRQYVFNNYPYRKEIISNDVLKQFEVNKKFGENSKEQNYWGTVSYDVPAEIVTEDNYHAVMLSYDGKQQTKTYSSLSYLLDLVEMSTQKYYFLEFDYKLVNEDSDIITISFIGSENKPDFEIDLVTAKVGYNQTKGYNRNVYSYEIKEKDDGWRSCCLIFKPDMEFKERVTALRFLINANFNENNKFFISNIALTEYSDVAYENNNVSIKPKTNKVYLLVAGGAILIALSVLVICLAKKKRGK